ncbi:DUF3413 domain-containing protein [Aestuariibacter halophilus]|uniref:DUF3413 domain-containing protein n=1 Tax=Fluctibacter halophilus TaxID=226011 RepID=A0ABS8G5Q9_9ALTE|nr:DUF3413 domain-containing protein [Aestuariibacter halophilus]MCC2615829.1 DUF3413 domain-containing protein [Aestuariibacter halophilus]
MILTETPRRKRVSKLVTWGHWFALTNILIAIVIASVYVFTSPLPGSVLGTVYLFSNWLSHIAFLTFMGFVIFILPLCYILPNAKLVKTVSSSIAALGLALLAFDALLYNKYGLHLSLSSASLIRHEAESVMAAFGWQQWGFLLLLFLVWLSFQLIIANALWQRIERVQRYKLALPITSFFMLCFTSSHALHVWADANLYQPIVQQDDMFPLSYPATAKTLMSKYGLLDLQNYQQRKALQFSRDVERVAYPAEPVYCGIDNQRSVALLVEVTDTPMPLSPLSDFTPYASHYNIASTPGNALHSILYGLPELYHDELENQSPVMLELPATLGIPVTLYSEFPLHGASLQRYTRHWDDFLTTLTQPGGKLAVGVVNSAQMQSLLERASELPEMTLLAQIARQQDGLSASTLYSNVPLAHTLSSMEDLAPTMLSMLGCQASPSAYSTGQNLLSPKRPWRVSTRGNKVIVLTAELRIEVQSNGNYEIFDRVSGEQRSEKLDTSLLSQAIKHLSRFNQR